MRKLLLFLSVVLLVSPVFSQNTLTIYQKDGTQISVGFDDKPVVTFTDNELVVKTTKTTLRYEFAQVAKFTFDKNETGVNGVIDDASQAGITLDEYTVYITGAKADAVVCLIGADGKQLQSYKTDADGSVTFSIAQLPEGMYIISSESLTCKILKK